MQRALDDPRWADRNNAEAESRLEELLAAWRKAEAPVIHVRHRNTDEFAEIVDAAEAVQRVSR